MEPVVVGAALLIAVVVTVKGAWRLIRQGFVDGDRMDDPRTSVELVGPKGALVSVDNWAVEPLGVAFFFSARPADRLLASTAAPVIKGTGRRSPLLDDGAAPLGVVDGGGEGTWMVVVPAGTTRLVLRLTRGNGRRVRVHKHVLTALPPGLA